MKRQSSMSCNAAVALTAKEEAGIRLAIAKRLASLNATIIRGTDGKHVFDYNVGTEKKFPDCGTAQYPTVPSWMAKTPVDTLIKRLEDQSNLRKEYTKALEAAGFKEEVHELENGGKEYGVIKDGIFYTYSAVNELDNNGNIIYGSLKYPLISEWVEEHIKDEDHPIKVALRNYLESFWLSKTNFWKKLGDEVAITIPTGMTFDEAKELYRYLTPISEVNKIRSNQWSEYKFLKELMNSTPVEELMRQGLIDQGSADERTVDSKHKRDFFESLSQKDMVLWNLTRSAAKFISRYDDYIYNDWETRDYRSMQSWEMISTMMKSLIGEEKRDEHGSVIMGENPKTHEIEPKLINSWTLWEVTLPYYITGALSGWDLAIAFSRYNPANLRFNKEEQAEYQFENWGKSRYESLTEWVVGNPDKDIDPHPESKSYLEAFKARLIEDEILFE